MGVSSTQLAGALGRARAVGMRLTERQERVVRGLWGVEGYAQLRPFELAREMGVHRHTVRDTARRALAALRRAGHLSDGTAPRTERRARTMPDGWAGLLTEDLAALVEAVLWEDGPWSSARRSVPGAEILRHAYGLDRPAHRPRPRMGEVAAELGFTSGVRFQRAYSRAVGDVLGAAGLEGADPAEVLPALEEKAAGHLRRALAERGPPEEADDPLLLGSAQTPNPMRGMSHRAVEVALAAPYGLLSRRERYVLGLRGWLGRPGRASAGDSGLTQGEVADRLGCRYEYVGSLERRATEKLRRLLRSASMGDEERWARADAPVGAEPENPAVSRFDEHPEEARGETEEPLGRKAGAELEPFASPGRTRKGGSVRNRKGLGVFTAAEVEAAVGDPAAPLSAEQRRYLAARKGLGGAKPLHQPEAARAAGLPRGSEGVRAFERTALEGLRSYLGVVGPERAGERARPLLGVSPPEVAGAMARARAAGARLTGRQERILRGLWDVEGSEQATPAELARELGISRATVYDHARKGIAALERGGHLSRSSAPEHEGAGRGATASPGPTDGGPG